MCSQVQVISALCNLDNELTSLDLDYSLRRQYSHTVEKFLKTIEGTFLQQLVDQCSLAGAIGSNARQSLNQIIIKIPPINSEDHHHHHGHNISTLPLESEAHSGIHFAPDGVAGMATTAASKHPSSDSQETDGGMNTKEEDERENDMELHLLEHMTIEDKQLRPCCVALCCAVLFQTWKDNARFAHLQRSVPEALMKCLYTFDRQELGVYTTEDPNEYKHAADVEEKAEKADARERSRAANVEWDPSTGRSPPPLPPTFGELLACIPFSSVVRNLEPQVEKLVKQRKLMEEAQKHAIARREARIRAILRTVAVMQGKARHGYFIHWANIAKTLKVQRQKLVSKFVTMKTPTLKMIFDAWHVVAITDRLERCADERDAIKDRMNDLKEQLEEAKVTEADLFANLNEQITRREKLQIQIDETKVAIEAQRVPGTKEIMFATAESFLQYGAVILQDAKDFLVWCTKAPSVEKIARMYWVDREELRMKEAEAKGQEEMDKLKEEAEIKEAKVMARRAKKEAADKAKTQKRAERAAAEASDHAEAEFNEKFETAKNEHEANNRQLKKEAEAKGEEEESSSTLSLSPFSPSEHGLTMEEKNKACEKAAKSASRAVYSAERERLAVIEEKKKQLEREKAAKNDVVVAEKEKKFKAQQERRDNRISEEDIRAAMLGMCTVPQDRLLLRWIKYHLRRSTRHGFPYRRKFLNFKNDVRDGVSYAVLLNKIAPESTQPYFSTSARNLEGGFGKMMPNLDSEIDPQVRCDVMLDQCARLDPPAVGFVTRGHILGFEPFLNAAFVTRLFLTRHGLLVGPSHPQLKEAQEKFDSLEERWQSVAQTASQLTSWDTWVKMRAKNGDGKLTAMLEEMSKLCNEISTFVLSLGPIRDRANRGYQEWEPIYDYMNVFLYRMYSVKMNQEEEATMGTTPDVDKGHAPFQLVDYRHEIKFLKYTQMKRDRIREMILMEATHHLRRVAIAAAEEEDPEKPLTAEEIEAIHAEEMPLKDIEEQIDEMEEVLRVEYSELRLIFEFYAAGGEGGNAFDMSLAEFTRYATEGKIVDKAKWVGKDDIKIIFDHAAGVEEEDVLADIGQEILSDDEEEVKKKNEEEERKKKEEEEGESEEKEVELDEDGNPIEEKKEGEEEEEEEEYSWTLGEGEKELVPKQWSETIIHFALRRYPTIQPLSRRLKKLIVDVIKPNACQANVRY